MKTIILKDNLKNGLDAVGRTTGTSANLPVLHSVLIQAYKNQIRLTATNLELALTKQVFGKIIEEGGIAVPYATLANIVNNISSERVNLETKGGVLVIKTDNYDATIQGVEEKEFPIIPDIEKSKGELELKGSDLKEALSKTVIAAEASDLRPEISGVLLAIEPNILKIVATDSFRLAEASIAGNAMKNSFEQGMRITVPLKTAQELSRVIEGDEQMKILTDETQIIFESESLRLISRTIEGKFPDYETIIPKEFETTAAVSREELVSGLKLAGAFAGRNNEVTLRIKDKKVLEIHSSDSNVGENKYLLPTKVEGADTEVIFNLSYLLDGIRSESEKEVIIGLNGEEKPSIIRSHASSDYFYILMPIKP